MFRVKDKVSTYFEPVKFARSLYRRKQHVRSCRRFYDSHNIAHLSQLNFSQYKTSDTIFILGSGSSINQLTPEQWDIIRQHDSLGFNFWPFHHFVPTLYMFEFFNRNFEKIEQLMDLLMLKSESYKNTPIIAKDLHNFSDSEKLALLSMIPGALKPNVFAAIDFLRIGSPDSRSLKKSLKYMKLFGVFSKTENCEYLLNNYTGSLLPITYLCYKYGYKNIVLCGVDLNNNEYFYDGLREHYIQKGVAIPDTPPGRDGKHMTNDHTRKNALPIAEILRIFNEGIYRAESINLYVALKSSALHPAFPNYFDH